MDALIKRRFGLTKEKFVYNVTSDGFFSRMSCSDASVADEVHLWRSVLDRALVDIVLGTPKTTKKVYRDAVHWFDLENPDFIAVCELACLKPGVTYSIMLSLIKEYRYDKTTQNADDDDDADVG